MLGSLEPFLGKCWLTLKAQIHLLSFTLTTFTHGEREASQHLPNSYHKNLMVLVTGFKHGTAKTIQDLPGAFWATLVYVVEVFLSSISGLPFRRPLRYGHS